MQTRVLELAGNHYSMGRQHAEQVRDLNPLIEAAMHERLEALARLDVDITSYVAELADTWEEAAQTTLDMLRGIADGLDLDWETYLRYTIASYAEDLANAADATDGCTVWGAAGSITRDGAPVLVKNRDYRPEHQQLQCLARARPEHGYRYAYVTSAGSPAVFSSGMNEAGLAIADTHVVSSDIGPGVARYSVEMDVLEHHDSVESALEYLRDVPHLGDGTLTLVDRAGDMAVAETGHSSVGVVRPEQDFVVSTNHFVTPELHDMWTAEDDPSHGGNSQPRYTHVASALSDHVGAHDVDAGWAQRLMSSHNDDRSTLCRHPDAESDSATISTVIFLCAEGRLQFANGQPCQAVFATIDCVR